MPEPTPTQNPAGSKSEQKKFELGASEVMYLIGLAFLFFGLLIWRGLGIALSVSGGVILADAVLNGAMKWWTNHKVMTIAAAKDDVDVI